MKKIATLLCSALILAGCNNVAKPTQQAHENSEYQEQLMRDGWTYEEFQILSWEKNMGLNPYTEYRTTTLTLQWAKDIVSQ